MLWGTSERPCSNLQAVDQDNSRGLSSIVLLSSVWVTAASGHWTFASGVTDGDVGTNARP